MLINNVEPTPYPDLNDLLDKLVDNLQAILGEQFIGAYLQGSFAVGDFDQYSDVDFAVIISAELSQKKIGELQVLHRHLYDLDTHWAQHLEGSYFPQHIIHALPQQERRLWYLDNGSRSLIQSDHCNTAVVRWVLRERGISLAGPPVEELVAPISEDTLREEIAEDMRKWGQEILANPDFYHNRFYQGFIVLSFCRMLHSLQTGIIQSKRVGAAWAKRNLDPSWFDLIDGAWATRPNPALSVCQAPDPEAFAKTLEFVHYCLNLPGLSQNSV
jgi:hypothetical protein